MLVMGAIVVIIFVILFVMSRNKISKVPPSRKEVCVCAFMHVYT